MAQRKTYTAIAGELGRSVSTISREVARNSGPNGYRAARADRLATVRQYFPKKTTLPSSNAEELTRAVLQLNERPRRALGWQTPYEVFWGSGVASTA